MVEEGRYCIDVVTQLNAVRRAVESMGLVLLEEHTKGCVREALQGPDADEGDARVAEPLRRGDPLHPRVSDAPETVVLHTGGLHYATEKAVVEKALGSRPGVVRVEANPVAQTPTVA